jgi:hypothetical protein
MKTKLVVLLFSIFGFALSQNQKTTISKIESFHLNADAFYGYDNFGYYYFSKDNVLFKQKDKKQYQYQNLSLGKIKSIDILNPLKVVLFYEDFNSAILIDNQFNEIQKIEFSNYKEPINAHFIGMASNNSLWVYNTNNQQIGLFNFLTNSYKSLGQPLKLAPIVCQNDFNIFQWMDEKGIWNSCDIYGKISQLGSIKDKTNVQFLDDSKYLYYINSGHSLIEEGLYLQDIKANMIPYKFEIVEKSLQNFYYKDQILSIFTNQEITNYKIQLP